MIYGFALVLTTLTSNSPFGPSKPRALHSPFPGIRESAKTRTESEESFLDARALPSRSPGFTAFSPERLARPDGWGSLTSSPSRPFRPAESALWSHPYVAVSSAQVFTV